VAEVQQLSISNYKTKNRIGVTKIVHLPGSYESMEVPKTEVGLDDLFSGDSFYAEQMKLEYEAWKQLNADQDITQEDYQMGILNTRAFGYESIRDTQENKEFWGNIAALVVIIGVTVVAVVVPPVGIPLALGVGGLYGSLELGSAVSGKDWISGRELGTGERWFRGALAPLDIVPGAMAVKKFSGVARTASLGTDLGKQGMKTSLKTQTQSGIQKVNDLAITAGKQAASRLKSAGTVVKERALEVPSKLANGAIEAGRVVDKTVENLGNLFRSKNSSHEFAFAGDVGKQTTTKPRSVEDTVTNVLSNIKWLNIEGKGVAQGAINVSIKEIKEIDFGNHIVKGEFGKKQLLPNVKYITNDNYKYTTDGLGRIVNVEASELVLKKADRNKYAQANIGGKDRLPDDDGGHLIAAQFNGPADIDNLVPQNSQINRRGGVWYEMETEWANALKEIPPKKVSVSIEPIYSNNSMRPDSFILEYEIEGQFPVIREIANKSGGGY
jgi:hypothetical protein